MESALYDFAEAAMGRDPSMRWSLSEAILRRQISPVFVQCAKGKLSADQALDVAIDYVAARVTNTVQVFNTLFTALESRVDVHLHGASLPALMELQELFMGLNPEAEWATDDRITRREHYALFVRVEYGTLKSTTAAEVFCDSIISKAEYYLSLIYVMYMDLTGQILAACKPDGGNGNTGETELPMKNGDDPK